MERHEHSDGRGGRLARVAPTNTQQVVHNLCMCQPNGRLAWFLARASGQYGRRATEGSQKSRISIGVTKVPSLMAPNYHTHQH